MVFFLVGSAVLPTLSYVSPTLRPDPSSAPHPDVEENLAARSCLAFIDLSGFRAAEGIPRLEALLRNLKGTSTDALPLRWRAVMAVTNNGMVEWASPQTVAEVCHRAGTRCLPALQCAPNSSTTWMHPSLRLPLCAFRMLALLPQLDQGWNADFVFLFHLGQTITPLLLQSVSRQAFARPQRLHMQFSVLSRKGKRKDRNLVLFLKQLHELKHGVCTSQLKALPSGSRILQLTTPLMAGSMTIVNQTLTALVDQLTCDLRDTSSPFYETAPAQGKLHQLPESNDLTFWLAYLFGTGQLDYPLPLVGAEPAVCLDSRLRHQNSVQCPPPWSDRKMCWKGDVSQTAHWETFQQREDRKSVHLQRRVQQFAPKVYDAWTQWRSQRVGPKNISKLADSARSTLQRRQLVYSFAWGYKSITPLVPMLHSFLTHADPSKTELVLLVDKALEKEVRLYLTRWKPPPSSSARNASNHHHRIGTPAIRLETVSVNDTVLSHCPMVVNRFSILESVLAKDLRRYDEEAITPSAIDRLRPLAIIVDARDVWFQRDPFTQLTNHILKKDTTTTPLSSPQRSFVGVATEHYAFSSADTDSPYPSEMNRRWLREVVGNAEQAMLFPSTIPGSPSLPPAILCAGVMFGTLDAITDFVQLLVITMKPACANDQGALNALFYGGLTMARFPHDTLIVHRSFQAVVLHLVEDLDELLQATGLPEGTRHQACEFRDCREVVYDVIHQLDRHPDVWQKCAVEPAQEAFGM